MKKMTIYEPAMCCSTGLCGVSVDPELLRISTALSNLKKNGIIVDRYNLTNAPQEFLKSQDINQILSNEGVGALPVTVVNGRIVMTKRYPGNEEIAALLEIDMKMLGEDRKPSAKYKVTSGGLGSGGCKGGCC